MQDFWTINSISICWDLLRTNGRRQRIWNFDTFCLTSILQFLHHLLEPTLGSNFWLSRSSPSIGVPRSGRFNEVCGFYDPMREARHEMVYGNSVKLQRERTFKMWSDRFDRLDMTWWSWWKILCHKHLGTVLIIMLTCRVLHKSRLLPL